MARYGIGFKKRAVARLLPPENSTLEEVARHVGVEIGTLERWRDEESAGGGDLGSATARLDAVLITSTMDEASKSAWCRSNGIHLHDLIEWRQSAISALSGKAGSAKASGSIQTREDRVRIQELERDLKRKNSALAETAALLVLSKEMAAIFRKGEDE